MNNDIKIMAKTIYGEARGEYNHCGRAALEAIGHVIMNRSRASKEPISAVCLKPLQFSCWNEGDPNRKIVENIPSADPIYRICESIANQLVRNELTDITNGANHYYSTSLSKPPYWARGRTSTTQIGRHLFFKL